MASILRRYVARAWSCRCVDVACSACLPSLPHCQLVGWRFFWKCSKCSVILVWSVSVMGFRTLPIIWIMLINIYHKFRYQYPFLQCEYHYNHNITIFIMSGITMIVESVITIIVFSILTNNTKKRWSNYWAWSRSPWCRQPVPPRVPWAEGEPYVALLWPRGPTWQHKQTVFQQLGRGLVANCHG